jgi:tetratricopeptide (TPR) repeat protein
LKKIYFILLLLGFFEPAYSYKQMPLKSCFIGTTSHKPCREIPNLKQAQVLIAKKQYVQAAHIYRCYTNSHPWEKKVYIDYIETERALENYCQAMDILKVYYQLFGEDEDYLKTMARVNSDAGYYQSALFLNQPLIDRHPKDEYLIATEASALYQSGRLNEGLAELNYLKKVNPVSTEHASLDAMIKKPLQDNYSLGARFTDLSFMGSPMHIPSAFQYVHQNDTVSIVRVPYIMQNYFNPNTSLLFKAQYEYYHADLDSGLETLDGQTHIQNMEYYLGINTFLNPSMQIQAILGDLAISNHHNFIVYTITENLFPTERLALSFQILHDLFRPLDIYNGSPLLVSQGILETTGRTHISYKLDLQSLFEFDVRYGSLSDGNAYTRFVFEPSSIIYYSNKTNIALALDLEWLHAVNTQVNVGYYAPSLYQLYEMGVSIDFNATDNLFIQFYGAAGTVKDNFTQHFGFATLLITQSRYSLRKSLDLVTGVNYVFEQVNPSYNEVDVSLGLNWKFS